MLRAGAVRVEWRAHGCVSGCRLRRDRRSRRDCFGCGSRHCAHRCGGAGRMLGARHVVRGSSELGYGDRLVGSRCLRRVLRPRVRAVIAVMVLPCVTFVTVLLVPRGDVTRAVRQEARLRSLQRRGFRCVTDGMLRGHGPRESGGLCVLGLLVLGLLMLGFLVLGLCVLGLCVLGLRDPRLCVLGLCVLATVLLLRLGVRRVGWRLLGMSRGAAEEHAECGPDENTEAGKQPHRSAAVVDRREPHVFLPQVSRRHSAEISLSDDTSSAGSVSTRLEDTHRARRAAGIAT